MNSQDYEFLCAGELNHLCKNCGKQGDFISQWCDECEEAAVATGLDFLDELDDPNAPEPCGNDPKTGCTCPQCYSGEPDWLEE